MGELDPFGREKGEDSLKEMGWTLPSSTAEPTVTATPPPAPQQHPAAPPTPTPVAPRRRRSPGGGLLLVRLAIPIAVLAAVGIGVGAAVNTGTKAIHAISIPQITVPKLNIPTTVTPAQPTVTPAGSMLRATALLSAVARLRHLGHLYLMRVAPDRINAQVVHGTKLEIVQIGNDGSFSKIEASGAGASLATFPWSKVDPLGPARMVRASGRKPSSVNYLVLSAFGTELRWYLYLKSGAYYSGDAAGRHVRRVG